jgi:crotonobetainyl-CoA:carnitine CoA-transferase CaiB-like acyl-CoA transferase
LPAALHDALAVLPLATITAAGATACVSVVPLSTHPPVPLWTFVPLGHGTALPDADGPSPLRGVRVVESTRRVQGPLAGHVLAMLGADVVRIEPPGGDPARGVPPLTGHVSARFAALNAGKRVVELDLGDRAGRAAARDLVAGADVFLHNWAPGRAESWHLTAAELAAVRPGLVYAAASGWGGHLGDHPPLGTDYLVQAHSGLAAALRPPDEAPAPSLLTVADVLGGLVCAQGVLAALLRRAHTGEGTRVETSLLSATGAIRRHRREFRLPLRTADGHVAAPAAPDLDAARWSTAELLDLLRERDVPAAAVATDLGALATDPLFTAAIHRPPWEFA